MHKISEYIRVTDVLYPFSGLQSVDPYILRNAADRGTKVHEICSALIDDLGVLEFGTNLDGYIESFKKWKNGKKFITKPDRFYCDEYHITGECDALYKNENGFTLVDFKTPAREGRTWPLQGSAYSYLAKKSGYNVTQIEFVKLAKDGSEPKVYIYQENFPLFLKCLELYKVFFKNVSTENTLNYL